MSGISADGLLIPMVSDLISDNPAVIAAAPSSNELQGISVGQANITATAHLDNRDVAQMKAIEVYQEQLDKVSLMLDQAQYHQSETPHLSWVAVYDSGYAVEAAVTSAVYGSDHPEVAQVNAATGVVSLQGPGKATITVDVTVGSVTKRGITTLTVFPEPWNLVAVNGAINHTIYDNEQKWTLKTKGGNIWGTADDYAYLYKTINMADFPAGVSIIAKIDSISDNVNPDSMIGLMIRESIEIWLKKCELSNPCDYR